MFAQKFVCLYSYNDLNLFYINILYFKHFFLIFRAVNKKCFEF